MNNPDPAKNHINNTSRFDVEKVRADFPILRTASAWQTTCLS